MTITFDKIKIKDPFTGELFVPKRTNQKFANRINQIQYNNHLALLKRKAKAPIEYLLDKNRTVIKNQMGNKSEIIKSREFLLGAGFKFGLITHNVRKNDKIIPCVYEYAIEDIDNEKFKIYGN